MSKLQNLFSDESSEMDVASYVLVLGLAVMELMVCCCVLDLQQMAFIKPQCMHSVKGLPAFPFVYTPPHPVSLPQIGRLRLGEGTQL